MRFISTSDTTAINEGRGPKVSSVEVDGIGEAGSVSVAFTGKTGNTLGTVKLSNAEAIVLASSILEQASTAQNGFSASIG